MFTVVLPVHYDDDTLPYTLNCLRELPQNVEVIFVLDRPSSFCCRLVWKFARKYKAKVVQKYPLPFRVDNPAWHSYLCGTFQAKGERVYWVGADIVFSKEIFRGDLKVPCKFQYIDADSHFWMAWFKLLSKFSKRYCLEVFPRNFLFAKHEWRSEEKIYAFGPNRIYFHYYDTLVLHLRRNRNHVRHYVQGLMRKKRGVSFLKVLLHSILFIKPFTLIGYLKGD